MILTGHKEPKCISLKYVNAGLRKMTDVCLKASKITKNRPPLFFRKVYLNAARFFIKIPQPGDSKGTFSVSSQDTICYYQYNHSKSKGNLVNVLCSRSPQANLSACSPQYPFNAVCTAPTPSPFVVRTHHNFRRMCRCAVLQQKVRRSTSGEPPLYALGNSPHPTANVFYERPLFIFSGKKS